MTFPYLFIPNLVLEWTSAEGTTKLCQLKIVQSTVLKSECTLASLALNLYSISFSLLTNWPPTSRNRFYLHIFCSLDPTTNSKTMNSNFKSKFGHLGKFYKFCLFGFSQEFVKIQNRNWMRWAIDGGWGKLYAFCAVHFTFPLIWNGFLKPCNTFSP